MTYYAYRQSKRGAWTVGSYDGSDEWNPESDHDSVESAMARTNFLNARASFVNEGGLVSPGTKEPFVPTRFDFYLQAFVSGLSANPEMYDESGFLVARQALDNTKKLLAQLDKQKL